MRKTRKTALMLAAGFAVMLAFSAAVYAEEEKGPGEVEAGCNFQKTDNVWKYKYSSWGYIDVYTWVNETTVKYESYAKSYHMEDSDTTYTDVNRDEIYQQVMDDCLKFQEMDK